MARGTWEGSGTWKTTDSGGGGVALVALVVVIAAGSGAASAAVSALMTIVIVLGSVLGVGLAAGIGVLIWRARSDRPGRPVESRPVFSPPPESRPVLVSEHKKAIGPPREIHLHLNVSPDQLAAILRHYTEEE